MCRIGIRREDKNAWERRVPLTPDHVAELVETEGLAVSVQPSPVRAFSEKDYRVAGAAIDEELAGCAVIFGLKEIPEEKLVAGKTYLYFSHTAKGQPHNMPMLRRLLELGCTLVDYEQVRDDHGRRLVFFGRHAGYAGMIDALWALGRRLRHEELSTPFEQVRLAHDYTNLDEATHHISRIGDRLRHDGLAAELLPFVCGFTGSGSVSRGAQEIFDRLPYIEICPEDLEQMMDLPRQQRNVLYKVVFKREHRFERVGGGRVDLGELAQHPDRYRGGFARWLPHLSMLVHGAFWSPAQPRLVTIADLKRLWNRNRRPRLKVIADISCDIRGGIEATLKATTPGDPVFVYDVDREGLVDGVEGRGPVILAVDNLPCQLPVESSEHFGDTLLRFVPVLARCPWTKPLDQLGLPREIADAVIAHQGKLTPRFAHLAEHLRA